MTDALERARDLEEHRITEENIAVLRQRIGIPSVRAVRPSFEFAAIDSMRNYARGIGDVNPFYREQAYAEKTVWGRFSAHPTFLLYMGVRDRVEADEAAGGDAERRSGGDPLAGVHSFYSGEEIRWFRPIVAGDRFSVNAGLAEVAEHQSRMGGRSVHETRETAFRDAAADLVAVRRKLRIRIDRSKARAQGKNSNLDVPHHYSAEDLAAIDADYEREYIRGSEPRYFEDVTIGETSVPLLRGPYTTTAYICYAEATGPRNDYHRAHSEAYRFRKQHPKAFPLNEYGYPDTIARVHWDAEMAVRAGLPQTYDFGGERVAWMSTVATHWMGDHGFLHRLAVRLRAFCFVGDTVWLRATVANKREERGLGFVDLDLSATNQRGEDIATGSATVALPCREAPGGLTAPVPVPDDATIF